MRFALYVAGRVAVLVPTLLIVSVLIFGLQQLLPGDAAVALAGEEQDAAVVAALRAKYHLDRPIAVQYAIWIGNVLRGDFGQSLRNKIPVAELLAAKLPVTVELAVGSMLIALAIGNALIPVITLGAIEFGRLLSGAVLTEQIFAIPGFGKLLVDGVFNRDYAVVQGVVLVSATLFVLLNLLADVLYFVANPRLRG